MHLLVNEENFEQCQYIIEMLNTCSQP